jgi:hypothetical protein
VSWHRFSKIEQARGKFWQKKGSLSLHFFAKAMTKWKNFKFNQWELGLTVKEVKI